MFYDMIQKYIDSFYRRHYAIISTSSFEEESVDNWIVFARDRGAVYSHVDSLGNGLVSSSIGPYETVVSAHIDRIGIQVTATQGAEKIDFSQLGYWQASSFASHLFEIKQGGNNVFALGDFIPPHYCFSEDSQDKKKQFSLMLLNPSGINSGSLLGSPGEVVQELVIVNNRIVGRGLDNSIGILILTILFGEAAQTSPFRSCLFAATTQEEIGMRGARHLARTLETKRNIVIDAFFATDTPNTSQFSGRNGDIRIGNGPIIVRGPSTSKKLATQLEDIARREGIPYQLAFESFASYSEAQEIQYNQQDSLTSIVAYPARNLHTPMEVVDLSDVFNLVRLVDCFIKEMESDGR
jgi:putative aminopeptidase FrvX